MNKSYTKIRHIQKSNILLERRYLLEGGDDPVEPKTILSVLKAPENQKEIKSLLWTNLNKPEHIDLKHSLGLGGSHTKENFLEKIGHKIHAHVSPTGHVEFEFPELKKKLHGISLNLGFSPFKHHSDDDHESTNHYTNLTLPHSNIDIGIKIPLSSIFKN